MSDQVISEALLKAATHPDLPPGIFAFISNSIVHLFRIEGEKTFGPITMSSRASAVFIHRMTEARDVLTECVCDEPKPVNVDWEKGLRGCVKCGLPMSPG